MVLIGTISDLSDLSQAELDIELMMTGIHVGGLLMDGSAEAAYREDVRELFEGAADDPERRGTLPNNSVTHASVVTEMALRLSAGVIRILSTRLNPDCYDRSPVIDALTSFLAKPNTRIEILLEDESVLPLLARRRFIATAVELGFSDKIEVRFVDRAAQERYSYNFLVFDAGYRFEDDRKHHNAVVGASKQYPKEQSHLVELFDGIKRKYGGAPVNLHEAVAA